MSMNKPSAPVQNYRFWRNSVFITNPKKSAQLTTNKLVVWAVLISVIGQSDACAQWHLGATIVDPSFHPHIYGITIKSIAPGDPAERLGLKPGDVVYEVNGRRMFTVRDMQQAIASAPGGAVRLVFHDSRTLQIRHANGPLRWGGNKPPALGNKRPIRPKRVDLNRLSDLDRLRLRDAMLAYIDDSVIQEHMDHHADMGRTGMTNGEMLLPWHRDFLSGMERHLANRGMTLPMWIPGTAIPPEFNLSEIPGAPGRTALLFQPGRQPRISPLRIDLRDPRLTSPAQLGRALNDYHNYVHEQFRLQGVPGNPMGVTTSPAAPLFWCWHAFLDQVYADWEEI